MLIYKSMYILKIEIVAVMYNSRSPDGDVRTPHHIQRYPPASTPSFHSFTHTQVDSTLT